MRCTVLWVVTRDGQKTCFFQSCFFRGKKKSFFEKNMFFSTLFCFFHYFIAQMKFLMSASFVNQSEQVLVCCLRPRLLILRVQLFLTLFPPPFQRKTSHEKMKLDWFIGRIDLWCKLDTWIPWKIQRIGCTNWIDTWNKKLETSIYLEGFIQK